MKNSEVPAFPCPNRPDMWTGMTKREYFAGMAMQGLISSGEMVPVSEVERCALAVVSVEVAEELLKELAK